MMPLTMVNTGEPSVIKKVGGKEETRRFLEKLGFVPGGTVTGVLPPTTSALLHNTSTLVIGLQSMKNLLDESE